MLLGCYRCRHVRPVASKCRREGQEARPPTRALQIEVRGSTSLRVPVGASPSGRYDGTVAGMGGDVGLR